MQQADPFSGSHPVDDDDVPRSQAPWARAVGWAPNLAVLAVLAVIGCWGHLSHWTLPGLSESNENRNAEVASPGDPGVAAARPDLAPLPSNLPSIEFSSTDAARDCGIVTAVAEQRAMDDVVTASGVVGYDLTRLAQLSVRVPGIAWRVDKRLGDSVERGDVLAIVDSAEVGDAKAALLEAAVVYNLKVQNLQRLEKLESVLALRELREAEAAREVSRAQRFNAVQKLINLGFPLRLEDIADLTADELATRLHLLGLPPSIDRETASANLIALVSPFAGVVTNCEVVRGELVEPSEPQYVVADISHMWINLNIKQEDSIHLRFGTKVVFHSEGGLRPVTCDLTWIGTEIDPRTRTVQARAEAPNPLLDESATSPDSRRLLQANAFGTAQILVNSNPASVVVPNDALHWQWEIGREVVFLPSGDGRQFVPRVVRKGVVRDGYAQIIDGVNPGEAVVTAGSRILSSELSKLLEKRLGDNAEAVRDFSGVLDTTSAPQLE